MRRRLQSLIAAGALAGLALIPVGCKSTDAENVSSRPWNSTEGWQSGFPSTLNEGR
jgi:hypothetical protein